MRTKVQKWGNSLAVRIPRSVALESHMSPDSDIDMTLVDGTIIIRAIAAENSYSLDELLAAVTDDNIHSETDWGSPVGAELL